MVILVLFFDCYLRLEMSSSTNKQKHWSRKIKVDKILTDARESTSKKQPTASKPTVSCYEFERQFITDLVESNGQAVLEYGMVCSRSKPEEVVQRAQAVPQLLLQKGGSDASEQLAELIKTSMFSIPVLGDKYTVIPRGSRITTRKVANIQVYAPATLDALKNIGGILERLPKEHLPERYQFLRLIPFKDMKSIELNTETISDEITIKKFIEETLRKTIPQLLNELPIPTDGDGDSDGKKQVEVLATLDKFIRELKTYLKSEELIGYLNNPETLNDLLKSQQQHTEEVAKIANLSSEQQMPGGGGIIRYRNKVYKAYQSSKGTYILLQGRRKYVRKQ